MFLLHKPSKELLASVLAASEDAELTYKAVGATQHGEIPLGSYKHDHYSLTLGPASTFYRAAEGLRHWKEHAGAGVAVIPDRDVRVGTTHINMMEIFSFVVLAPVRVVYIIDEPDRFGWAYGTLPGHPEEGEELFLVQRTAQGTVEFDITAFSRPAEVFARAVAPVTRIVQKTVTKRYLKALKLWIEEGTAKG